LALSPVARQSLRVREFEEIKPPPYAPVSHPFVERLIGTIRRALLGRAFFWKPPLTGHDRALAATKPTLLGKAG
jgi:hypothetical protein